jgi:hypothetical protein
MQLNNKNQNGSALILLLCAVALLGLLLSSILSINEQSISRQSQRADLEAYNQMLYSLKSQLNDPLSCFRILGGSRVPNGRFGVDDNFSLNWQYQGSVGLVRTGWQIPNSRLRVANVRLQRSGDSVTNSRGTVRIMDGVSRNYTMIPLRIFVYLENIHVNFDVAPQTSATGQPIYAMYEDLYPLRKPDLMLRVLANIDNTNTIRNCFGFESFAGVCQLKGGSFRENAAGDFKCQPDRFCFMGNPVIVNDPTRCTSQTVGAYRYRADQIGDIVNPIYMCNLCHSDL